MNMQDDSGDDLSDSASSSWFVDQEENVSRLADWLNIEHVRKSCSPAMFLKIRDVPVE